MSEDFGFTPCSEYPQFTKLASNIVRNFESEVDTELDGMIEDETLEALEMAGIELRSRTEAAIDDAFHWGAAVAFGLIALGQWAKRRGLDPSPCCSFEWAEEGVCPYGARQCGVHDRRDADSSRAGEVK